MTHADDNAYPLITHDTNGTAAGIEFGLSKRELFAGMAMQGILSNDWEGYAHQNDECDTLARVAVNFADALIKQLNIEQ